MKENTRKDVKQSYFHNNGKSRVKVKPDSFPVVISPLVSLNNVNKENIMENREVNWSVSELIVDQREKLAKETCRGAYAYRNRF